MTSINSKRVDDVATINLDGPDEGNMLSVENLRQLAAAIRQAGATDIKVIAVVASGPDFCRGRAPGAASPTAMKMRANVCEPILDVYDAIANVRQPIIAIVHGRAHGFGAALAGACDITIAVENARFRLPEMEKDLPPTLAISALMPRVHRKALTYMVYSMEEIDAQTALQIGLVSKVVRADEIAVTIERLAATMEARSREALFAVKEYFRVAPQMEPRGAADYGANLLAAVLSSAGK
jgi:enoyl-CoA hydratase